MIFPIILAGGTGTRLWPLSRKSYPKQFSKILGSKTLFQERVLFSNGSKNLKYNAPIILTNENYRFIVKEQLMDIGISPEAIIIEPTSKNTAPAILVAALYLDKYYPNASMLVTPSDHFIENSNYFELSLIEALGLLKNKQLVTFGIKPTRPETGYGYLKLSENIEKKVQKLEKFVEKPNKKKAEEMIKSKKFLWNSGIFLFRVNDLIDSFSLYSPELLSNIKESFAFGSKDLSFFRLGIKNWENCQNISIDYAILEKANNLSVVQYNGKWLDMGSWDAVWEEKKDNIRELSISKNVSAIDCKNSLLRSENDKMHLVGLGLENIIAVAMTDAVLVANKNCTQDVKRVVQNLKENEIIQAEIFPKVHRPWGWFESLETGARFQVKKIMVLVGGSLSLQSHKYRSEHWIIVEGTAKVTIEKEIFFLEEGQSVYVPLGAIHRLENGGKIPLILIEIQTGIYLGEDDIIRYKDSYSRS